MSRSYKKHPYYTDGKEGSTTITKRFANKTVRKYKHKLAKGKAYKRLFCSYDIHDYISRWSWEEAKKEYESDPYKYLKEEYPSLREFYKFWSKYYKRK